MQDFEEEQNLMARLMHQLQAPSLDEQFEVLKAARDRITQGGPNRLKHTIPAIAFGALAVVRGLCAPGKQGQSKAEPVGAALCVTCDRVRSLCARPSFVLQ